MNRFTCLTVADRRGSVLVAAVIVLVILQLVVATMVIAGGREGDQTKARWGQSRAFYNAESAAAMSLREIKQNTDIDGDGTIGSVSDDGADANNPVLNGGTLRATYTAGSPGTITTSGSAIGTARGSVISVSATSGGSYRPGLYLESWVIASDTLVDAFDWTQPPTTVGWAHNVYWPNQATGDMMFTAQTASAVRLTGKINIAEEGVHEFGIDVDDDVKLVIDGATVLHANSVGACRRITGPVHLTAGLHDFVLYYTDGGSTGCLMAWWMPPNIKEFAAIPPSVLSWAPEARLPSLVTTGTISFSGSGSPATAAGTTGWNGTQNAFSSGAAIANEGDIASNATGSNTITGYNGSTVRGDASVGLGGNATTDTYFNSGASVTGTRGVLTRRAANVRHRLPAGLPSSSGAVNLWGSNDLSISADRRYDSIGMSGTSTITVSGDCTVYVTGSVNLSNSSQIIVGTGSVLRLYVDGSVNVNNASIVNPSGVPGRCYIYMLGSGQSLGITNTAQLHGHVRAPLCTAGMSADAVFSGTLFSNTFQASNQAQLRLDCGPLNSSGGGGGGGGSGSGAVTITAYTEP